MRAAITTALEAITPDTLAHSRDLFREVQSMAEGIPVDRNFILNRTVPQEPAEALVMQADPYRIVFELSIAYIPTPQARARMLNDGDLVVDALKEIPADNQQIHVVEINGASDFDDEFGTITSSWQISAVYDRRTP